MSLSTMQDIGGCRIIVPTLNDVYSTVSRIKKSQWKHKFKEEYDYIKNPKDDGYRCYHLVYSYRSNKNEKYNGLFIEIQIRTKVQHLWATAVETMDEVDNDELKIGNGKEKNKQFFKLASALMQLYEKDGYSVNDVRFSNAAKAMRTFEKEYHVIDRLSTVRQTEALIDDAQFSEGYFLLRNNPEKQITTVHFYNKREVEEATTAYDNCEKERLPHESVVLVSTSSIDSLQKAYSNYFSNIGEFVALINTLIQE